MSNWRSRLTHVAWAAPTAALCALVTRDQQYSLAKVASGSAVAERTYVSRIECGRWASLPEEASWLRACLRLRTRDGSGPPPMRGVCSLPAVGSGKYMGVRDLVRGPGPPAVLAQRSSPGHAASPDPSLARNGSGGC